MTQLILYAGEDGHAHVQLQAGRGTVWLSQREMVELFDVLPDNIGLYLKNVYDDGELYCEATTEGSSVVQTEGDRKVRRTGMLYRLDAILAVGYRVRSPREVQFCPEGSGLRAASYGAGGIVSRDEGVGTQDQALQRAIP